jgi:ABC-type transport system involved in cytochrome bd biosynthesis fused ATPase/permease subunit
MVNVLVQATSALDNESERVVQKALDELMVGRTTIIVAHRLSTIRTADQIVVIDRGVVVEQGTYDQLIKAGGMFAALASVHAQRAQHDHDVLASSSAPEVVATAAGDELQLTQNKLFAQ